MSVKKIDIQLQERDVAILQGLLESRIMTSGHIEALYFDGRQEARKQRLRKLKTAGLIAERERNINEQSVHFLTKGGFDVLEKRGILSQYPRLAISSWEKRAQVSPLTVNHELSTMDVKAAFSSAIAKTTRLSVAEFSTWPALDAFEATLPNSRTPVTTKPDGFIRIREREPDGGCSEHSYFLEVDRSTESQERLALKCASYTDFYRRGGFALRNGASRTDYEKFPFRVLLILKNAERRNNIALRLVNLNPPILTQIWLTTIKEIVKEPLGNIWTRPIDCRAAVEGTAFAATQSSRMYRRQSERETFIEKGILKLPLFPRLISTLPTTVTNLTP